MKPSSSLDSSRFKAVQFQHKSTFLCLFCGGQSCKYQDHATNTKLPNAIEGLHSNWVTDRIIASQRLSQRLIAKYNLLDSLKKNHIETILNVQQPGQVDQFVIQHASCGDGIVGTTGFSYYPERLYDQGIKFFNMGWQDMSPTSNEYMMKLINIFALTFDTGGKILVHCHAGRGRTMIAICAWLIFAENYTAEQAIELAIEKRDGVLTKGSQRKSLKDFEEYVKNRRISFGLTEKFNLERLVDYQQQTMLQTVKRKCQNTPFVHKYILDELLRRLQAKLVTSSMILKSISHIDNEIFQKWNQGHQQQIKSFKAQLNKADTRSLTTIQDIRVLTQTLFDFYEQLHFVAISLTQVETMLKYEKRLSNNICAILAQPQVVHLLGSSLISTLMNFAEFFRTLFAPKIDKQNIDSSLIRIVKALHSKKKYQRGNYLGRQYNFSSDLTETETFLVKLFRALVNVDVAISSNIRKEIRRLSADMHYHMQNQKKKQLFSKAEMQELYLKCLR